MIDVSWNDCGLSSLKDDIKPRIDLDTALAMLALKETQMDALIYEIELLEYIVGSPEIADELNAILERVS